MTIGGKKKTATQKAIDAGKAVKATKRVVKKVKKAIKKATRKKALPKTGFKTVAKSVLGKGYDLSNEDKLRKFFNKDGSLNKRNLRSNRQREEFKKELAKAKEEIKQIREQRKEEREQKREQRKRERKRKKQNKAYTENGRTTTHDLNTYNAFIDILDEVYDEVALIFYDSDQIMQMIENPQITHDDIVKIIKDMNKRKEESLTDKEKELLKRGKYKLSKTEHENLSDEVATMLYLSSKTGGAISPQIWYRLKETNPQQYYQEVSEILTEEEIREYIK